MPVGRTDAAVAVHKVHAGSTVLAGGGRALVHVYNNGNHTCATYLQSTTTTVAPVSYSLFETARGEINTWDVASHLWFGN